MESESDLHVPRSEGNGDCQKSGNGTAEAEGLLV